MKFKFVKNLIRNNPKIFSVNSQFEISISKNSLPENFFFHPGAFCFLESFLDFIADQPIDFLHLSVGLRMSNRSEAELDVEAVAELVEFSRGEVAAVVHYDAVRHAKSISDALKTLTSVVAVWFMTGMASIHLVNLLTATRRYV